MPQDERVPRESERIAKDRRRRLGDAGEQLAADHLARRGFQILERNYRTRWGELDIVACDGRTLIFCEVKCRIASRAWRDPLESVHPSKRAQIRRIARRWLAERRDHPRVGDLRFDAIGVTLDPQGRLLRLDHVEAAF
jgi:putative endonuclease